MFKSPNNKAQYSALPPIATFSQNTHLAPTNEALFKNEKTFNDSKQISRQSKSVLSSNQLHPDLDNEHKKTSHFYCTWSGCLRAINRIPFKRKYIYENHMRMHNKNYDFQCGICNKAFTSKDYLKRHLLTHDKKSEMSQSRLEWIDGQLREKVYNGKFVCHLCSITRSYVDKQALSKHMKSHHPKKMIEDPEVIVDLSSDIELLQNKPEICYELQQLHQQSNSHEAETITVSICPQSTSKNSLYIYDPSNRKSYFHPVDLCINQTNSVQNKNYYVIQEQLENDLGDYHSHLTDNPVVQHPLDLTDSSEAVDLTSAMDLSYSNFYSDLLAGINDDVEETRFEIQPPLDLRLTE